MLLYLLYEFAVAAVTKSYTMDVLHSGVFFSHTSRRWKSKTKVVAEWVSSKCFERESLLVSPLTSGVCWSSLVFLSL